MDLDDILNQAEDHETVEAGAGSSLGGEGFLQQLAIVQDVKADLSWDDIIPLDERERVDREEIVRMEEAQPPSSGRKRAAAQIQPGAYEGMDPPEPSPSATAAKKSKPAPPRKTAAQRAMELKDRDLRVLVRSLQRWGDIRLRYDDIVRFKGRCHRD
jgi:chromodomain-helicase-DNA-binding protein 1